MPGTALPQVWWSMTTRTASARSESSPCRRPPERPGAGKPEGRRTDQENTVGLINQYPVADTTEHDLPGTIRSGSLHHGLPTRVSRLELCQWQKHPDRQKAATLRTSDPARTETVPAPPDQPRLARVGSNSGQVFHIVGLNWTARPDTHPCRMLFNSQIFIIVFLPVVLSLYYALAASRPARQAVVVLASIGFYAWWDVRFVPLLVALTVANWLVAQWFGIWRRSWIPLLGVAMNLLALGVFKYADFLRGTVFGVLGENWQPWSLILPLGISFFVFQKISYLIDLRRGDRHIYGFLDFCMFVTFFPQLIAGPLVRHNEIIYQFDNDPRRPQMWENLSRGFVLFLIGVTKKVALADTLAMP